jgi:hypothetical protein
MCFHNLDDLNELDGDDVDGFDVGFNVWFTISGTLRTLDNAEEGPDTQRATLLVEKAARVHNGWMVLHDHFEYLRNREGIHESMNNEIMSRLTKWTYIEALLVIGMAVAQVVYWKKFFEQKRYL